MPQSLSSGGGTPSKEASTSSPADGAAPTTPAPATPATSSEAARQPQQPREQPQAVARSARTAFRAPAAQPALPISAAEQLRQLEEQQVADVAAELQHLEVSFSSTAQDGLFAGIKLGEWASQAVPFLLGNTFKAGPMSQRHSTTNSLQHNASLPWHGRPCRPEARHLEVPEQHEAGSASRGRAGGP